MIDADCYVSVIAPLHNDSDLVESFVVELIAVMSDSFTNYELVLVDDCSSDDTVARVGALLQRHERIRLLRLSRRFGQEIAISAGLDSVIGDFVVVMLPDSDPPTLVPEMIELARKGAETVYGIRRSRVTDPFFLRFGAGFFYWYCDKILNLDLPKNSTHFRVLSRRIVNALIQIKDRGRYLRTLSQHVGYRSQGFPYDLVQRRDKPRTKGLVEAIELAVDIIVANSLRPLRIVSWVGLSLAAVNGLYFAYVAAIVLFKKDVAEGWVTQSLQVGVMFLFVFLILAVLSAYVGRIVEAGSGHPLYYVMEEQNSSVLLPEEEKRNITTESTES